jgi:polar amino acid transport system substrate-binding protein
MERKKRSGAWEMSHLGAAALAALIFCAFAAAGEDAGGAISSFEEPSTKMPFLLLQIQADLQGSLEDLDMAVAKASGDLSASGLEGEAAREVLRGLLAENSDLVEAVTFSEEGKILVAECEGCEGGEGEDISGQEHIAHILRTKNPTFSGQFLLVEGYHGTAIAYPVFSPEGEFIGGISAILKPEELMDALVAPQLRFDTSTRSNITDYSFWSMHLDGLIAYDRDESQIGKLLFEDPLYQPFPSLLDLAERIVAERAGHGYYTFQVTEEDERVVTKESYWTTVGLHGREWRIIVTRIVD